MHFDHFQNHTDKKTVSALTKNTQTSMDFPSFNKNNMQTLTDGEEKATELSA